MTELAAVVLAHNDRRQVRRLIAALEDVPVVLHCDAGTAPDVAAAMLRDLPPRVTLLDRRRTTLASWSLVAAELAGVRVALQRTTARHIAVLSGSDYPLLPMDDLLAALEPWQGTSWLWNRPMPFRPWDTPRRKDGGMWRFERRFLTRGEQVLFVGKAPLYRPGRRRLPADVEARAGAQWKIYGRDHAERLLHIVDSRPDLVDFWRTSLVPDETFAASTLGSSRLLGSDALPTCAAHAWYAAWGADRQHPHWLGPADFDELSAASRAAPMEPATAFASWDGQQRPGRKLFARQFSSSASAELLDRIDAELRGGARS